MGRGLDADHVVSFGPQSLDGIGRADWDGQHDPVGTGVCDPSQTGGRGRTGGDAVVDDEDGLTTEVGGVAVAAVAVAFLRGGRAFLFGLLVEIRLRDAEVVDDAVVQPDGAVAGDCTDGQFRVPRGTDLPGDDDI